MKQINNTIYIKFLLLAAVLFSSAQLSAQDEEATSWTDGFSLSGSVDAYYRANLNGLNKVMLDENGDAIAFPSAPGSSFANDTGFAIGMANAILSYEHGNVGAVADLVFGPRGEDAVFNSFGSPAIVNQLYVYWNVSESVTLTFGNFNTKRYDILMLLGGECGRLACCADRHERAGTAHNLALYQRHKSVPVNGTIPERCDESWD